MFVFILTLYFIFQSLQQKGELKSIKWKSFAVFAETEQG